MGVGSEKENQGSPANSELHSIEAERQGQGPPKAPSQVLPHQVGGIAVERWWQNTQKEGGLLVTKRKPCGLKWEQACLSIP